MPGDQPGRLDGPPFIVLGAPRSGTTYLQSLIDADPRIVLTNETRVLTWLHRALRDVTASDRAVARQKAAFVRHLEEALPELVRDFYRGLDPAAQHWGDKNPFYCTEEGVLETIEVCFPGSRYVHIVRDGRDVVTSLYRRRRPDGQRWAGFEGGHEVWLRSVAGGRAFGATVGDRYMELRYEDLIAADEHHLRRVMDHLGLAPSPEALALARAQEEERTPVSDPTRDLDDVGRSAWGQVWSPDQQLRSLQLLGDALVDLGYETEDSLRILRDRVVATTRRERP